MIILVKFENDTFWIRDDKELINCLQLNLTKLHHESKNLLNLDLIRLNNSQILKRKIVFQASLNNDYSLKSLESGAKVLWDNYSIMENIMYCDPPRFLIVEDNVNSRMSMKHLLKIQNKDYQFDNAANGKEAIQKFKNLFNKG